MKIRIISPGKFLGKSAFYEIFEEYRKRLKNQLELVEINSNFGKNLNSQNQKIEEEKLILKYLASISKKSGELKLPKFFILDENGKQLSSIGFADFLNLQLKQGERDLNFIIGGACGLSENLKKLATHNFSLGLMTFPHMMVRCIIAEQIYRAFSIIENHPYHRS